MKRPSDKELEGKIKGAREAAEAGRIYFVDPLVVEADLTELDFLIVDLPDILGQILNEIGPKCYAGTRPPQRSFKPSIKGRELFAFSWESRALVCPMYFKFTLKDGYLWIVSFHKDRPRKGSSI